MSYGENDSREPDQVAPGSDAEITNSASGGEPAQSNGGQAKPVSPQKLSANRENGKHSKGPTTPEGKAKSSQNSRKHGFFARQPLPPGEEGTRLWQAYGDLVVGIWEYYQPVGYMEELLTEKIATESIRFSRLLAYESKYVGEQRAFHWDGVDRLLRFQGAINRQLFQAMRVLERLQDRRKGKATPPKGSAHAGDGSAGPSVVGDDPNHRPKVSPTHEEAPTREMNMVSHASQWEPIPMSLPPAKDDQPQASQPTPLVPNYGTNPTGAGSKERESSAPSNRPSPRKPSLADRATQVLGLPPAQDSANLASTEHQREQDNSEEEDRSSSKFIAAGDQAVFDSIQESIRKEDSEDPL